MSSNVESVANSNDANLIPKLIVGIGASAGGLEALQRLFEHLPSDTGLAFVVVQHLSPDFKSLMDELLGRHTEMSVFRVEDGMQVRLDAVYLIPPKKEMIISNGRLLLTEKDPAQGPTLPIDHFFRSLAQDVEQRSVAIVLSGTGSDGSRGILDVREAGGLVIAQDVETARFDGMPKAAVETGVVDLVLSPEQIAETLLRCADHPLKKNADIPVDEDHGLKEILKRLREVYGLDFNHYKPSTVLRRIERRLLLKRIPCIEDYSRQLADDPQELNQLYCDLLIGVTQFFRDREAFEYLQQHVLPGMIESVPPEDELRMWVAGCATGEEAYSLAILVHERLTAMHRPLNVKIFATDVHRSSLETASAGIYTSAAMSDVSSERRTRYFTQSDDDTYRVTNDLRNLIVFAPHNIIKDAPFTRLDLITCRNLLIYLQPPAQKKVLSLFHFGLKTGGVVFLGPSEGTGDLGSEFDPLEPHWKLYRKRRDVRLAADLRVPPVGGVVGSLTPPQPLTLSPTRVDPELIGAYDSVLQEFMPPSLLIDRRGQLIHAFHGAGFFLTVPDGRPSAGVLDQLPAEIRTAVLGTLQRTEPCPPVVFRRISVPTSEGTKVLDVGIRSLPQPRSDERCVLISFGQLSERREDPHTEHQPAELGAASRAQISTLESELRYTRENLQATIEELETSNEELQATNEELVASNEELQSTNEELHSVNEELYTVNAEHQKKIEELTELTSDMDNLLESTLVHTIFLDCNLCIRKFTPQIADSFHLLEHDIGRRIDSFSPSIQHPDLIRDVESVLETGEPVELEVPNPRGNWYLLRILPYHKQEEIDGVVLTLIDITKLKEAEFRFSGAVEASPEAMLVADGEGTITQVNSELERRFGYSKDELVGQPLEILMPEEGRERHRMLRNEYFKNPRVIRRMAGQPYIWGQRKNGSQLPLDVRVNPITTRGGTKFIASLIDISHHQALERSLRKQVVQRDHFLATLSHELRNPLSAVMNGVRLLQATIENGEVNTEALVAIARQSEHMARLLDDLLDVSRVTAGKIEIRREHFDLRDVVDESVEATCRLMDEHNHTLRVSVPDRPLPILGDRARLLQVVENLLNNAAKYTPDAGRIELKMHSEPNEAVLQVRDNGQGIAPELLDSIFDMFVQSDETLDRSQGGMGVGLTLVRSLVRLHQGTITVQSNGQGTGSLFEVRLPRSSERRIGRPPSALGTDQTRKAGDRVPRRDRGHPLQIVLVEDQADNREMLSKLLELEGCEVHTAVDGREGLDLILSKRPNIALVDIGLPKIDGYEVARRVREELRDLSIQLIALTGYGQKEDRVKTFACGFDAHIVKPIRAEDIQLIMNNPITTPSGQSTSDEETA